MTSEIGHPPLIWRDWESEACSIARTAALIGQPWMLLVLRDLFNGVRRFDELADHLGIARNVLARRLATLVDAGVVQRTRYREPGKRARQEYRLTPAGHDLRPVLLALRAYGDRHLTGPAGPPALVDHAGCGGAVRVALECEYGHRIEPDTRLTTLPGPGARLRAAAQAVG